MVCPVQAASLSPQILYQLLASRPQELETVSLAGCGPHGSLSMSAFRRSLQHNLKAESLRLSQSFAPTTHV